MIRARPGDLWMWPRMGGSRFPYGCMFFYFIIECHTSERGSEMIQAIVIDVDDGDIELSNIRHSALQQTGERIA